MRFTRMTATGALLWQTVQPGRGSPTATVWPTCDTSATVYRTITCESMLRRSISSSRSVIGIRAWRPLTCWFTSPTRCPPASAPGHPTTRSRPTLASSTVRPSLSLPTSVVTEVNGKQASFGFDDDFRSFVVGVRHREQGRPKPRGRPSRAERPSPRMATSRQSTSSQARRIPSLGGTASRPRRARSAGPAPWVKLPGSMPPMSATTFWRCSLRWSGACGTRQRRPDAAHR